MAGEKMPLAKPYEANRRHWDAVTPAHVRSKLYDVEGFLAGRNTVPGFMLEEIGDVRGRSLLHLQCHFGMDTLSFARLGADVTGADFSGAAVREARRLAKKTGLTARFIEADVLDPGNRVPRAAFDIVFTSHGVVCWLGDLTQWERTVARSLKPGGVFHIFEFHPLVSSLSQAVPVSKDGGLRFDYSYFNPGKPDAEPAGADYADPSFSSNVVNYQWGHSIGEIFGVLTSAGLTVTSLKEYPFTTYCSHEGLVKGKDGRWRMPPGIPPLPMQLYVQAARPG
jgi:SAM-dependent methyltransferase